MLEKFGDQTLQSSHIKVKSFTGHKVPILGTVNVVANKQTNKAVTADTQILITDNAHNLVGRDLIETLGLVTVNLVNRCPIGGSENDVTLGGSGGLDGCLSRHADVFKDELGKIQGQKAKIHVDRNEAPIFLKSRSIPFATRGKVEVELDRLERDGVIERVEYSDWATPIVPVLKASGQVRICGDYKVTANQAI